jgi:hypothetical protein
LEFDAVRCYAVMFESVLDMLLNFKKNYCWKLLNILEFDTARVP